MEDFEDLVYKYLDGQTTPEENDRLNRRLKDDAAAADFFVRIAKNEAWVQSHHAELPQVRRPLPSRATPAWQPWAIAAGVLLAFLAVLFFSTTTQTPPPLPVTRIPRPDPRAEMVEIERESREAQKRLAEAQKPPPEMPKQKFEEVRREAEAVLAKIEERRREVEKVIEEEKKPEPPPPPKPATAVAVATVDGRDVFVAGQELQGPASIVYPDGTKVELGPETLVRDVPGKGKGLFVAKGFVAADVVRQAQPMVFSTPQGEARVLGTQLALTVAESVRLEVKEGKVRFTKPDGRSLEVTAGHYTLSTDLKLISSRILLPAFDFATSFDASWGKPAKWLGQSGQLQATRTELGSSTRVLVVAVPAHTTVEVSARMRCPKVSGGFWMELAARPGEHPAEDFDANPKAWMLVKKFDSYAGPNGNGNVWTKYSKQIPMGTATKLTVGFKLGSTGAGDYAAAWDSLRVSY